MTAETIRIFLVGCLVSMYGLSLCYLRQRRMTWSAYAFWGIFALLIPALGPFLVILLQPGRPTTQKGS
ncbi:MAG: hypothetical protein JXA13_02870 [Anaerolineales bacterium]|nr:hypothetical protein [Anaerolineales bacterium]